LKDQILTGLFTCILPSSLVWQVNTTKKDVFITFDDGPIPDLTDEILRILAKYDARATFFCVGDNVKRNPEIYSRIIDQGHSVGNHSFHHLKGWNTNFEEYLENIRLARQLIDSGLYRPPYGLMSYRQAKAVAKDYKVIMWSVLTRDYDPEVSKEECLQIALNGVRPGAIIVFHDNIKAREKVLYALPLLLEHLEKEGYRSEKLDMEWKEKTVDSIAG
jgi:peptidoglycan-N-acetylglucosamine deacetylase